MENFNFENAQYDVSDEESFEVEEDGGLSLFVGWIPTIRYVTPNIHRIVITAPAGITTEDFVEGVERGVIFYRNQYGLGWRLSGIIFDVTSINPGAVYYKDQITHRSIRISDELLDSEDIYNIISHHIEENTTPAFVRGGSEEISDDVVGTYVVWNLTTVKFWFEQISLSESEMTIIVGEKEIHPGVFTKKINLSNHHVQYETGDCLFICLNEVTGKMWRPKDIRCKIWPQKSSDQTIHTLRHITEVCKHYDVNLRIYDAISKKFIGYNKTGKRSVNLVKCGMAIGLFERIGEQEEARDEELKHVYAYFDLETVQSGSDDFQRIYAYSFKSDGLTETVCYYDVDLVENIFAESIKKYLLETPDIITYLYAWNGSRFDAKIIVPLLQQNGCYISHIINNGANELLSASIKNGDNSGTIILRDPCKLFPDTLNGAAKTLGIEMFKDEIDHNEVEIKYISGGNEWREYVTEKCDIIKQYVRNDVYILEKVVKSIMKLYSISIKGETVPFITCFSRSMAAGHLWFKLHDDETREMLGMLPQGPYTKIRGGIESIQMLDLMKHVLAARVQAPYGKYYHDDVILVDAKSMYPSRAVLDWYPCGKMHPTRIFVEDKLGLYEVSIFSQNHPHVLPSRRNKNEAYNWKSEDTFTKWVTSVDVDELIENKAEFRLHQGVYWDGKTRNYFYSYMTILYELRKAENDIALNLHYKILMNALLGSLLQEMLREYSIILTSDGLREMLKKYGNVISVGEVHEYNNGRMMCVFKPIRLSGNDVKLVKLQEEVCKSAIVHKPGILTWFVLAYSRRELRRVWRLVENVGENCRMIYCDTDSLMFTNSEYAKHQLKKLGLLGKDLGQWDIEYENAEAYIIRSKFYALRDCNGIEKVRIKGVKKSAYCRTINDDSSLNELDLMTISSTQEYDERSILYKKIVDHAKDKSLGPCFQHVKDVYNGSKLQVVNFQMHKTNGGIMKKYMISKF